MHPKRNFKIQANWMSNFEKHTIDVKECILEFLNIQNPFKIIFDSKRHNAGEISYWFAKESKNIRKKSIVREI